MNILREINAFIRMIISRALIISYKKIEKSPEVRPDNFDIGVTINRYKDSLASISVPGLLDDLSIKDNFYFLEKECLGYFDTPKSDFKILDVGCGSGIYSKVFGRSGSLFQNAKYVGAEIDERFTTVSKKYLPEADFIVSAADDIALKDSSIDLVFCSSALHYTLDKWKKSLKEFARVSRKYVAITRFPVTKYNKTFYVHQTVRGRSGTENHYFVVLGREDLEKYFDSIGLKILKRDYSSQEYNVKGVDEKIILIQYLLEKNGK